MAKYVCLFVLVFFCVCVVCLIVCVLYGGLILYETLYCLPPAWASQPLQPRPKVVDAEFEISQRFLPRRPVSSDHHEHDDDFHDDFHDDDEDEEEDQDLEMVERTPFKSERSAKFPEKLQPIRPVSFHHFSTDSDDDDDDDDNDNDDNDANVIIVMIMLVIGCHIKSTRMRS